MHELVLGELKYTSQKEKFNKIKKSSDSLSYKYSNDPNIKIGVLGFVDDTLRITECGDAAIVKNTTINSFVETHRQTMHDKTCGLICRKCQKV